MPVRKRWLLLPLVILLVPAWQSFCEFRSKQLLKNADLELLTLQRLELVEDSARKLLWYSPENDQGKLILGIALYRQGKYLDSVNWLETVNEASNYRAEADTVIGESLLGLGKFRQCENHLSDSLSRYPDNNTSRKLLYKLYMRTLRIDEAVETLEGMLHGTTDDLPTLTELVKTLSGTVSPGKVFSDLLHACPHWDREPGVSAALGKAAILQGMPEDALRYMTHATEMAPENKRISLWNNALLLASGETEQAGDLLDRWSPEDKPDSQHEKWIHSEYWKLKSTISQRQGNISQALEYSNKSLLHIRQPEALALKAGLLRRLSRNAEAEDVSGQLVELGKLDFELLKLNSELSTGSFGIEQYRRIGQVLSNLGYTRQARSWRAIAESISQNRAPAIRQVQD